MNSQDFFSFSVHGLLLLQKLLCWWQSTHIILKSNYNQTNWMRKIVKGVIRNGLYTVIRRWTIMHLWISNCVSKKYYKEYLYIMLSWRAWCCVVFIFLFVSDIWFTLHFGNCHFLDYFPLCLRLVSPSPSTLFEGFSLCMVDGVGAWCWCRVKVWFWFSNCAWMCC